MKHTVDLLAGLEVHENAMQKNLDITRGAIVSEAVMMGLGKTLGRSYAHDLVYDLCREAIKQDKPLVELLAENEEVRKKLTREELESLCDPANYLGYSVEMVNRVLKQTAEQRSEPYEMRVN
jgi:3-carboxy-cis,cis-muconate cycloisomerase